MFARYNGDHRPNGNSAPSLSVGDVVLLDGECAFACAPTGWDPVSLPPGSVVRDSARRDQLNIAAVDELPSHDLDR